MGSPPVPSCTKSDKEYAVGRSYGTGLEMTF